MNTFSAVLISMLLFSFSVHAADFPPREKNAIQPVTTEEAAAQEALPKENMTPEAAKTGRVGETSLSEIHVTLLFGVNQNGAKAHKIDYKLQETKKSSEPREPAVRVSYKKKSDEDRYAVTDLKVKRNTAGPYTITASILELKPGETKPETKITYLE